MPKASDDGYRSLDLADVARRIDALTQVPGDKDDLRSGLPKFRRILVGVDGSAAARQAVDWAGSIARLYGASVTVMAVAPPAVTPGSVLPVPTGGTSAQHYNAETERRAELILDEAVGLAALKGLKVQRDFDRGRNAARRIVQACKQRKVDLVVVGSHGQTGMDRLFLGSVANGVKHHAPCSVLITKNPPPPYRIVAGTDGSSESARAVRVALGLGGLYKAPTTVVHAHQHLTYGGLLPTEPGDMHLETLEAAIPGEALQGRVRFVREHGRGAAALMQTATKEKAGLIVVGSRGLGALGRAVLGSTSDQVSHQALQSVLIVRNV